MKYGVVMSLVVCTYLHGMKDVQEHDSLTIAFKQVNDPSNSIKCIFHQFDIQRPEHEKQSALSRLMSRVPQITNDEMHAISCDLIGKVRDGKYNSNVDNMYDYVITDNKISSYNVRVWDVYDRLDQTYFDIITSDYNSRAIFIYNISGDSIISVEEHIERIKLLRNEKLIVNIAKNRWNQIFDKIYSKRDMNKRKDIMIIRNKVNSLNSHFFKSIVLMGGTVVLALLAFVYYHVHH